MSKETTTCAKRRFMTMPVHKAVRIGLSLVLLMMLLALLLPVFSAPGVGEPDFLPYWAAARLLGTGGNPYDPSSLRALGHEIRPDRGQDRGEAFASWNPPWLLLFLLPLGLLPFDLAVRIWFLCQVALIVAASVLAWRMLARRSGSVGILLAAAVGLGSGQSVVALLAGQVSVLLLIGLVLGAWWLHAGKDRLAGAALLLSTIKPQVTYFVLVLLALWVIRHRRWQVFVGLGVAGVFSMAVLWAIFPGWMSAYFDLMGAYRSIFFRYSSATIGSLAYTLWRTDVFRFAGLLLLPSAFCLLRVADSRGWLMAMNVALLISVPLAIYGFAFDQVVLLPAVLQMLAWLWDGEIHLRAAWLIGGGLVIVYIAFFPMLLLPTWHALNLFACIPLAWAGLYALAWKQRSGTPESYTGPRTEDTV